MTGAGLRGAPALRTLSLWPPGTGYLGFTAAAWRCDDEMIRLFKHYLPIRTLLLSTLETAVLFQCVALGLHLHMPEPAVALPVAQAGTFTLLMLLMMTSVGLYQAHADSWSATFQKMLVAYGLAFVLASAIFRLFTDPRPDSDGFATASVFGIAGLLVVRLMLFRVTDIGLPRRRVLVLGSGRHAEEVIDYLTAQGQRRSIEYAGSYGGHTGATTDQDPLGRAIRDLRVSEIVIAMHDRRGGVLPLRQMLDARLAHIKVMDLSTFYERERGLLRIDCLRASWLIFGEGFEQGSIRLIVKRAFDIVVSLILLTVTLPIIVLAILAIVIEDGWPVLYRQERVGQGGVPFTICKLRSMRHDAERDGRPQWARDKDDRVTRVGRFIRQTRIDELPQLINVLRGEMSFVGPRPERAFFIERLISEIPYYNVRHSVKPGITGWSQVRYPYGASVEDALAKLQYDLYYVKNHSLFLDLLILVETAQVVLLGKGAR